MKNFPVKTTDPETGKEITIWNSRSMAVAMFVFTKDKNGKWRILANKRGSGCPDYVGYWVCPCGYLDYNESLAIAAMRECEEETGVNLSYSDLYNFKFYSVNDDPSENRQNVTARFYTILDDAIDFPFSTKNSEANEVADIRWIKVSSLDQYNWAFNHDEIIKEIFEKRINIPWYKKIILKLYERYVS